MAWVCPCLVRIRVLIGLGRAEFMFWRGRFWFWAGPGSGLARAGFRTQLSTARSGAVSAWRKKRWVVTGQVGGAS